MSVINTNYLALVSQNNLSRSQGALGTAIERLSSGMRINSAKDDAAGQAIANRFSANIKGLTQASRNANDGVSIAQTTEGALNEVNNNLQRIRELSVQAANGSNSDTDLQSIQNEINERLDEIDRISAETQFNGKYVLGEDGAALTIQVGAHDGEQITINLQRIDVAQLNLTGFSVADGIDTTNVAASAPASVVTGSVAADTSGFTGPAADVGPTADPGATGSYGALQTDGTDYFIEYSGGTAADGSAAGNGWYAVTVAADGSLTVDTSAVASPTVADLEAAPTVPVTTPFASLTGDDAANLRAYTGDGDNDPAYVIVEGTGDDAVYYTANISEDGEVTRGAQLSVGEKTADPLAALDDALQQVDNLRSHLGAIQNRFESTIANLNNTVNNLSAARSRIEDADYAVEVSNMTRAQILQQAGTSVLAQANQVPQTVLSLLR